MELLIYILSQDKGIVRLPSSVIIAQLKNDESKA